MAFGLDDIIAEGLKTCHSCGDQKPLSEFYFRKDTNAYRNACKECRHKQHTSWYEDNKEGVIKRSQIQREEDQIGCLLSSARASAKRKNLDFNLNREDIVIPEKCPYLGIILTNIQGDGVVWSNASIDRIDSSKGYTKDNIQIISRKANTMKNFATQDELVIFAKAILGER